MIIVEITLELLLNLAGITNKISINDSITTISETINASSTLRQSSFLTG